MTSFVNLHVHSHYSLLDGVNKIDDLVNFAKEDGAPAIALTDHGVMYGAVEFFQKCVKAGIKPLVGVEAYVSPSSRLDKTIKPDEKNYHHLILLAKNLAGYKNLIKLTSIAHLEGFYYKPRIDWETLVAHKDGLICCSACLGGEIPQLIINGNLAKAKTRILQYAELFGPEHYYLELQHHEELPQQAIVNQALIDFSYELNLPLVATNDAHYNRKDDDEAQDILLCLQNKRKKSETNRMSMMGGNYSLRPGREMIELFAGQPEALANTVKIAELCNLEIPLGQIQLPHFEVPDGHDGNSYLRELSLAGCVKRYGKTYDELDAAYRERLDFELEVVAKMGWPSYFLIVADFINWSKDQGIFVGPGRGSAAGSIVCYLIGITELCPIKYDLLFERFLNPERISMPDIDTDFSDTRRDEVIKYVQDKYGYDHVAQIITFGTMAARAALKDVGRVLDYPYDFCDKLSKALPFGMKIKEAIEKSADFKNLYDNDPAATKITNYAIKLEGVARHASVHACGILITKDPLTEYVPVQYVSSSDKSLVSQYSLHPVEDLGLLKMDFLGLKNLTIIEAALKIIKNTRGLTININDIPLDDQKSYDLFCKGETTGVFQFESGGIKRYLKELKPSQFEDLIAMVALYRPGPMEWIPDYINGKHGRKKVVYLHEKLKPILEKTYGVAIYQEQVMQMARALAGFTMGQADVLRKAMGKKIAKLLSEQKIKFIDGCVQNGIASELAETIFSFIEPFAGYGFNRSHAACYAMVAYQTAYLKANWPTEFMAALLTADQNDSDRIAIEIDEARDMGIEVKAPDVNQSFSSFTVVTPATMSNQAVDANFDSKVIRFGLRAIKNVGQHIADLIISERKANGPYKDLTDLLTRIEDKDLNKKSLESLIKAGALESFGERGMLLANSETLLAFHKDAQASKNNKQSSLFGETSVFNPSTNLNLKAAPPVGRQEKLAWEKELLGLYISEHPFADFKKALGSYVKPLGGLKSHLNDDQVNVAGVIVAIKKIMTRSNDNMLFVKIEDGIGKTEVLVFPGTLKETLDVWQDGKVVLVGGTVSDKDGEIKLLANKAVALNVDSVGADIDRFKKIEVKTRKMWKKKDDSNGGYGQSGGGGAYSSNAGGGYSNANNVVRAAAATASAIEPLKLIIKGEGISGEVLGQLKEIFAANPGSAKVYIKINQGGEAKIVETAFKVNYQPALVGQIRQQLGAAVTVAGG